MILGLGDEIAPAGSISDARPILIVTGLVQEARIAAGPGKTVICSSSNPLQLRSLLSGFDAKTVRGVISFGVAGGLDPDLKSGDVVVATEVMAAEGRWQAGLDLSEELIAGTGLGRQRVVRAALAGAEEVIKVQATKAALRAATGAAAVDMESHIAAAYAANAALPFAALRVISDPATRSLPDVVTRALGPDGSIALGRVLRGVIRNPTSIAHLLSTGLDFNRALKTLRDCRGFLVGDALAGEGAGLVAAEI